jgi:XTP/dITP diphosphohydrolase
LKKFFIFFNFKKSILRLGMDKKNIQLVIASKNVHKIREYKEILKELFNFDVLSLLDFPKYTPKEESSKTFRENAISKALNAAKALNKWVIADDSGLIVPALKGQPGIVSARYAGKNASDVDNRKKLLAEMKELEEEDRNAYFECCIALASPEGLKKCVCATCEGSIAKMERGGGGFGYDPLFIKHEYSKTFAELEASIKNRISHRRKALDKLVIFLETLTS